MPLNRRKGVSVVMRNFLKVSAVLLILAGASFAQDAELGFQKGDPALGVGFFLGGTHRGVGAQVLFDGALNNFLSLGGEVQWDVWRPTWTALLVNWKAFYNVMRIVPNVRFAFHAFGIPPLEEKGIGRRHDPYVGFRMGYKIPIFMNRKDTGYDYSKDEMEKSYKYWIGDDAGGFNFDWLVGYRFYPKGEKFHFYADFGGNGLGVGIGF